MPTALYQKYRPQTWEDLTDQQAIKLTLTNEIVRGQVAHAYFFVGPRGVGKTTTARLLAKAVNCTKRKKGSSEPCNECQQCVAIQAGQSMDIIEIDAASHTGVDHVRERVLEGALVSAGSATYRVFIIDEVHMLSTSAFNAMLKILEEPPEHVIFILATTEAHKVPQTIISRCQRFDFQLVPLDAIRARLSSIAAKERVTIDDDVLRLVAARAEGSLRDAESMLGQIFSLGEKKIGMDEASLVIPRSSTVSIAKLFDAIFSKQATDALGVIEQAVGEGVSVPAYFVDAIEWLRVLLLYRVSDRLDLIARHATSDFQEQVMSQATKTDVAQLSRVLEIFLKWRKLCSDSPIPQLPLEMATIESIHLAPHSTGSSAPVIPSPMRPQPTQPAPVKLAEAPKKVEAEAPEEQATSTLVNPRGPLSTKSFTAEQVVDRWSAFIDAVKEANHSLAFLLTNVTPAGIAEGVLELRVPFAFHQEQLGEPKYQRVLEDVGYKIFGEQIKISAQVG